MYKILLIALSCAFFSTTTSMAADQFGEVAPPPSIPDWNELYFGLQAGFANAAHSNTETEPGPGPFANFNGVGTNVNHDATGFGGGAHIGARMGIDAIVVGAIADLNVYDTSNQVGPMPINNSIDNNTVSFDARWTASARATVGIPVQNLLFYGTAGATWMNADFGLSSTFPMNALENQTLFGYTVGAGVEWRMTDRLSFGVEYLHTDFEDSSSDGGIDIFGGQDFNFNNEVSMETVMFKIGFRM